MPTESIYGLAQQFAFNAFGHLWQGTLFASLMIVLAVTLGRAPARLRYNLYLLASIKFLIPSALVLALGASLSLAAPPWIPQGIAAVFDIGILLDLGRHWLGTSDVAVGSVRPGSGLGWVLFLAIWASGAVGLTLRWGARSLAVRRMLAGDSSQVPGAVLEQRVSALCLQLGLRRNVSVRLSRKVSKPGVWGIRLPTILLPEAMPEILTRAELDAVLLHELAHVERRDNLVSQLSMGLRCWLWFHPLVWWLDRRLLAERERACDERVLELSESPAAYLRGLAKVLHFGISASAVRSGGVGGRLEGVASIGDSDLRRRIAAIRRGRSEHPRLRHHLANSAAICLLGLSSLATSHFETVPPRGGEIPALDGATWERAACERAYWESQKAKVGDEADLRVPSLGSALPGKSKKPCDEMRVL